MEDLKDQIYLLEVPKNQKTWFNNNYGFINDDDFQTDGSSWEMLKSNIFGNEWRFIDYDGNSESLISGFWMGFSSGGNSTINTQYFLDSCIMAMNDCIDLEFYEMAFNIKTVYNSIQKNIKESEIYWSNIKMDNDFIK